MAIQTANPLNYGGEVLNFGIGMNGFLIFLAEDIKIDLLSKLLSQ